MVMVMVKKSSTAPACLDASFGPKLIGRQVPTYLSCRPVGRRPCFRVLHAGPQQQMTGCFNDWYPAGGRIPILANGWLVNYAFAYGGGPSGMIKASPDACAEMAAAGGWSVFGLRESMRCYVGFDSVAGMAGGANSNCGMSWYACAGSPGPKCGGTDFLHVYTLPGDDT